LKDNLFCRRNIRDNTNFQCRFDGTSQTADCPIVSVGYILDQLKTNRAALLFEVNMQKKIHRKNKFYWFQGGLIEIRQDWTCNFDFDISACFPTYKFSLLQSGDDKQSPGINYRYKMKF
jgi:hypothetical protein